MATSATGGALYFEGGIDVAKLYEEIAKINASIKAMADNTAKQGSLMDKTFSEVGTALAFIGGTAAITMLGKQILDTTAKFEKFGIVLSNTLGETQGAASLDMISKFAATTPFQLDEVTGAFIKMANQGFVPTYEEMTKLGDVASSTGKSFDQLTEAILDAQAGQFERLKEFGIKASVSGDKVTFSFKEQQTTVDNTNSSIRAYILSLGDMKGVAGANALISASLTGQLSNLQDKLAMMYNEIGKSNKGVMYSAIGGTSTLIDNYETVGKVLMGLVAVYGTYKAAVMIANTLKIIETTAGVYDIATKNLQVAATIRAAIAQTSLNKAIMANPYALMFAAIAAVISAIAIFATHQSDLEKATVKANLEIANETDKVGGLFVSLEHAAANTEAWEKARKAIIDQYGAYLPAQLQELKNSKDQAEAQKLINEGLAETIKLKTAEGLKTDIKGKANEKATDSQGDLLGHFDGQAKYQVNFYTQELIQRAKDTKMTTAEMEKEWVKFYEILSKYDKNAKTDGRQNAIYKDFNKMLEPLVEAGTKIKQVDDALNTFNKSQPEKAAKPFDATTLSLQELMKELPNATAKLNEFKEKGGTKADISGQTAVIAGIRSEIEAREKQLYVINDVEAQIKRLQDEQKGYAANDAGYKEREARIAALKARLPETSKKEVDQIKAIAEAMKTAVGDELLMLARKLIALENINKAQEKAIENAKGVVYGEARDAETARLLTGGVDPEKKMDPISKPVTTQKQGTKLVGLEVEKLKNIVANTTKEVDKLDKALTLDQQKKNIQGVADGLYFASDAAGALANGFKDSNPELAETLGIVSELSNGIGNVVQGFATGNPVQIAAASIQLLGTVLSLAGKAEKAHQDALNAIMKSKVAMQREYNLALMEQNLLLKSAESAFGTDQMTKASTALGVYQQALAEYKKELMGNGVLASDPLMPHSYYDDPTTPRPLDQSANGNGSDRGIAGLASIRAVTGHETSGLFGWGKGTDTYTAIIDMYPDLIDANKKLNVELAKTIVSTQNMTDQDKERLQYLIDLQEKADKALEAMSAYINTTFGSLGPSVMDALTNSIKNGTDAWDEFGKAGSTVLENLGKQIAYELFFSAKFKKLQKDLEGVYGSGKTTEEIGKDAMNTVSDFYKGIGADMQTAQQWTEQWKAEAQKQGFELWANSAGDSTRTAATKGLAAMNQDTANELNGRFTAIQGHTFSINEGVRILTMNSASMLKSLQGIESNSKIWQRLEAIDQNIAIMNGNVESINLKGITLKK